MKESKKKYIILIVLLVVFGAILAMAFAEFLQSDSEVPIIRNEITYIIVIALGVLLVALFAMLIAVAFTKKRVIKDSSEVKFSGTLKVGNVTSEKKGKRAQDEEEGEDRSRFYMLSELDANRGRFFKNDYNDGITLKILCDEFRAFACSKLRLYYSIDDIRKFIAGMSVSKIVILQGMSGTGKTSLAYAMGEFIGNPSTVIPVQPMWKERTDLVGYYNEFTKRFNETTLLQKMYEANYNKDIYVTILDEMNIARVEYYFAEFLSLLEIPNPDRRYLDVVTDEWDNDPIQFKGGQMKLPNNMWFVGTANNDDSTFAISDKVYDRAMIMNLDHKCEPFKAPKSKGIRVSAEKFFELTADAIKEYSITVRNAKRLEKLDEYMIKVFNITFGNRIMKQINTYIPVYVACGGEELEALDDILSKKVLRKLETQNPVYIRSAVDGFCDYLDELFGQDKMKLCKEYVQRIKKNV